MYRSIIFIPVLFLMYSTIVFSNSRFQLDSLCKSDYHFNGAQLCRINLSFHEDSKNILATARLKYKGMVASFDDNGNMTHLTGFVFTDLAQVTGKAQYIWYFGVFPPTFHKYP